MSGPAVRHCRNQRNLQRCHNEIQEGLSEHLGHHVEKVGRTLHKIDRRATKNIAR